MVCQKRKGCKWKKTTNETFFVLLGKMIMLVGNLLYHKLHEIWSRLYQHKHKSVNTISWFHLRSSLNLLKGWRDYSPIEFQHHGRHFEILSDHDYKFKQHSSKNIRSSVHFNLEIDSAIDAQTDWSFQTMNKRYENYVRY